MQIHRNGLWIAVGAALVLAAGGVGAAENDGTVSLDQLLKIPSQAPVGPVEVEKRSGKTRSQWQRRYRMVRKDLVVAEDDLVEARQALEERMGEEPGQWKMTPPGIGDATQTSDAPTDYRLSQQLKRGREEVERAERAIQDLDVEANLAGVPEDWRKDAAAETR